MFRSMKDLEGFTLQATDGEVGHLRDLYFDDAAWVVRYLVVETGNWLSSRRVLISPIAIGRSSWSYKTLSVGLSREQVKKSPAIDTEKPVSRQHEMEYLGYYGYPYYWGGAGFWGAGVYPSMMGLGFGSAAATDQIRTQADPARAARYAAQHRNDDPHLRSGRAIMKYDLVASDGHIGHVQGLLLDDETWAIRYLIADPSNWWLGHQVLIAPAWIRNVSWPDNTVMVDLNRQAVKDAPPYDSTAGLDRLQENRLHRHYQRSGYWVDELKLQGQQSP